MQPPASHWRRCQSGPLTGRHALIAANGARSSGELVALVSQTANSPRVRYAPGPANVGDGFNQCLGSSESLAMGLGHWR
jgi:hypothetical protein